MAWFKQQLRAAEAPWRIWGHSFGTLSLRVDPQNLPPEFADTWPSTEYGYLSRSYTLEHREIFSMARDEGITGLAICVGDKHSFWAGYASETLPPRAFEPAGVCARNLTECLAIQLKDRNRFDPAMQAQMAGLPRGYTPPMAAGAMARARPPMTKTE